MDCSRLSWGEQQGPEHLAIVACAHEFQYVFSVTVWHLGVLLVLRLSPGMRLFGGASAAARLGHVYQIFGGIVSGM